MRNFLLGVFVASCFWLAWHSVAGESWLVLSGIAVHLDGGDHCNNRFTKGIGLEKDGYAIGVYDNSNCRTSIYAAKSWMPLYLQSVNVRIGVIGGVVSGYSSSVMPVGGLVGTYERKTWGANVIFIPPTGDKSSGVMWLQGKYRWR